MFRDKVRLKLKGGDGGDGIVSIGPMRRSDGGNGGNGGAVYLEGTNSRFDLTFLRPDNLYAAEDGVRGGTNNKTGAVGEDKILRVPLATVVYNKFNEKVLEITEEGERKRILRGGNGGRGNYSYRGSNEHEPWKKFTRGEQVEAEEFVFELELQSDYIFIGYPNAGKSTILNELTNAEAKIAPYEFTTIDPQKGRLGDLTLLDLPGLIEGTYEGKGLGTRFVKHTKRTKAIAHFVSFENEDMNTAYEKLREELKNINQGLYDLPEVIILTKKDLVDEKVVSAAVKKFKSRTKKEVIAVTFLDEGSMSELVEFLQTNL